MKQTHRFLAAFLVALLLLSAALPALALTPQSEDLLVTHTSPAIPANSGEAVDLSAYDVMMTASVKASEKDISWSSDAITVERGKVTPSARGVYALTATAGGRSRTVYLVVKNPDETEYVLYEEDFDKITSFEELGYDIVQQTNASCTTTVQNGKLVLTSQSAADNYIRVLLPEWLGAFGNYKMEINAAMTATQASGRWMSLMVRVQNNNYPYYQMAIRADATTTNGTEIALRTEKNAWDVQYTAAYSEKMTDKKVRTFSIEAYDNFLRTAINGETISISNTATMTSPGRVGLQVRACEMSCDSIRITLQLNPPKGANRYVATVEDPKSNVILPPSVIAEIGTEDELNALQTALAATNKALPATAIFTLDDSLNAKVGAYVLNPDEILELLNRRVIPCFRVESSTAATKLASWMDESAINDVFVLSSDAEVLKTVRSTYSICRAVLDLRESLANVETVSTEKLTEIRAETNKSGARICLLPANAADADTVFGLQRLLMTVWTVTAENTDTARVSSILSGANGIITSDFASLSRSYTRFFEKNTVVRPSVVIGHRGIPSLAPENTLAGSMLAYEKGATAIENDVYLTKDGVVVVMHDKTLDRTTNGTGNIEDYTYEQLKSFLVDAAGDFEAQPIPTLEEYLIAFKGLDVQIVIEIKTSKIAICQAVVNLVKQYDMEGQINVIAFGTDMLKEMKRVAPEISVGYLTSTLTDDESNPTISVMQILNTVQTYDSTYNPTYNSGALGPNLLRAASHRGIAVLPWTINDRAALNTYFLYGTNGITTNYSQYFTDCLKSVSTDASSYSAEEIGVIPITISGVTYGRETLEKQNATLILIEGDEILTYEHGTLQAYGTGTATVMFSVPCTAPNGDVYYLCTAPITVRVGVEEETTTESESEEGNVTTNAPETTEAPKSGCGSVIGVSFAVLAAAVVAPVAVVLKKKEE